MVTDLDLTVPDHSRRPLGELWDLHERVAVVTGAGRGIGRAIALRLAEAGARVAVTDVDRGLAEAVAGEIHDADGEALALGLDARDPAAFRQVHGNVAASWSTPDVWVNNVGTYPVRPTLDLTPEQWDSTQALNVRSAFLGAQQAAIGMAAAQSRGVIINISSVAGVRVSKADPIDYCVAKAGVTMLTQRIGSEFGALGIRVVGIAPGFVITPGAQASPEFSREIGAPHANTPLGRQMVPDDIARVAVFLASDMAAMVTSQVVVVDGGGRVG